MGIFSAFRRSGITALAVLMPAMLGADSPARAEPKDTALVATAPSPAASLAIPIPSQAPAVFRMEGTPKLESAFGDVASYKSRIDAFTALGDQMETERRRFARAAHTLQTALGPAPRVGAGHHRRMAHQAGAGCPSDAVAKAVVSVGRAQTQFHELGISYERSFRRIRELHDMGESAGLTPDYRTRVMRSRSSYRRALRDMAEMNSVMQKQLQPTLKKLGCATVEPQIAAEAPSKSQAGPKRRSARKPPATSTPKPAAIRARVATFFVDNRECGSGLDVYVDATLLGRVPARTNSAFQASSGRHSLCLLSKGSVISCGDIGTIRTAFVHDGFRIQRSCEQSY